MELLSFHDQFIAYLSAHEEHDNFAFIDIIQGTHNPSSRGGSRPAR
jgi:hypothetical protein